ncbi:CinA domain protein [[Acidovorax] ebreus TPSY]|uniref:CinA domain protein n=1 Tax=Acidovorax ebreus (strain TPSY) TaxID=535289 RepID=A0A9J9UA22_ACIET|nr:CinA domain protein [[Acidovorax] ebreus TPSY]
MELSKIELPALDGQALEADLIHISTALLARGWMLATAESCTGGLIAAACTDLSGSSQWFERGFVSYSNAAKTALLGVPADLITAHGAVSEPVARAMAEGAVRHSAAQVSVAVTGVAGPHGRQPGQAGGHGVVRLVRGGRHPFGAAALCRRPRRRARRHGAPRAGTAGAVAGPGARPFALLTVPLGLAAP